MAPAAVASLEFNVVESREMGYTYDNTLINWIGSDDFTQIGDLIYTWRLDGGPVFGRVPRALWEKEARPDAENRVEVGANVPLIRGGGAVVIVDSGLGRKFDEKLAARYAIEMSGPNLLTALASRGVAPEDVTHVVLTHLHFDHAGWNTRLDGAGRPVVTFPRARYLVQRGEWDDALHPTELNRGTYLPENLLPVEEARRFEFVKGDFELLPGLKFFVTGGHTRHHQTFLLDGGAEGQVLFLSELLPSVAHRFPAWVMAYDHFPDEVLARKKELTARAAAEGWLCLFNHESRTPAGYFRSAGKRPVFEPEGRLQLVRGK